MQSTELIRDFLCDRLGVDAARVVSEAILTDLGVDSLLLAELVFEAEDRLGVSMDGSVKTPSTVGDLAGLIDALQSAKVARS